MSASAPRGAGRNPRTNEPIKIRASPNVPKFRLEKALKDALN